MMNKNAEKFTLAGGAGLMEGVIHRPEGAPRGVRRSGPTSTSKGRRFSRDARKPRHARKER